MLEGRRAFHLWKGYVAHSLLFYRQNRLAGRNELAAIGRRLELGPAPHPPCPAFAAAPADPHGRLIRRGLSLGERVWGSRRLSPAALGCFESAVRLDPSCPWAELLAGMALEMRREYADAGRRLELAAALAPGWAWPRAVRGICRWYQAEFRGAAEDFARAWELDPQCELHGLFLARAKSDLRDRSMAADLGRCVRLAARRPAWQKGFALSWRGRALFVLRRDRAALADLRRAVRLLPDYDRGPSWLGISYMEQGRETAALPLLRRARELNPYYPTTLYPLARACMRRSLWSEAGGALKAAAAIDRAGVWVEHRISQSHPNPAARRSLDDLDFFLAHRPRAAWAWAWRGQTELILQNYRRAGADLDRALALRPSDSWARLWRGEARRRLGYCRAAMPDFAAVIRARGLSWAWAGLGYCRLYLGRPRAALEDLERALELQPRSAEALCWRAEALSALGRARDAAADWARALELRPHDHWISARSRGGPSGHGGGPPQSFFSAEVLAGRVRSARPEAARRLEEGDYAGALRLYGPAVRPRELQDLLTRGWLRLKSGDFAGAVEDASRALEQSLDPASLPALWLRAQGKRAAGEPAAAAEDLGRLESLCPKTTT